MTSKLESKWRAGVCLAILALAGLLYVSNLNPARFGLYHDDSLYVTAAKSLATGHGYRYIGLPIDLAQTKYPVFYPFLLSMIWRVFPEFPANVMPMMGLSVLLAILFLLVSYLYLVDRGYARPGQVLLILLLVALNPIVEILSGSVLSDLLYATLSVAALWMVERLPGSRKGWWLAIGAGVALGLSYLTRSVALALVLSAVVYLGSKREFKKALGLAVTAGCFIVPWVLWCQAQAARITPTEFLSYYFDYVTFYRKAIGGLGLFNVLAKNASYLSYYVPMLCLSYAEYSIIPTLSKIFVALNLFALAGGFVRRARSEFRLAYLYVLTYVFLLLFWPFPIFERLLVPILPLLLLFLTTELIRIAHVAKSAVFDKAPPHGGKRAADAWANRVIAIVFLLLLLIWPAVILHNVWSANREIRSATAVYADQAEREKRVFKWIEEHTNPDDVFLCYRDQVYYLSTGRKAAGFVVMPAMIRDIYTNKTLYTLRQEEYLFNIIKECHARYLVTDRNDFLSTPPAEVFREKLREIIAKWPQVFVPAYRDASDTIIYRIAAPNQNP